MAANTTHITEAAVDALKLLEDRLLEMPPNIKDALLGVHAVRIHLDALDTVFEAKKVIEQAKHVLMIRGGMIEEEAHRRIQKAAVEKNLKCVTIAASILEIEKVVWGDLK